MIRTKEGQEKHDGAVAKFANALIREGWSSVYSDLPGNQKPPKIGDYIPDIYGRHGFKEVVIEIETSDTKDSHALFQHATFNSWARGSLNREFLIKIV